MMNAPTPIRRGIFFLTAMPWFCGNAIMKPVIVLSSIVLLLNAAAPVDTAAVADSTATADSAASPVATDTTPGNVTAALTDTMVGKGVHDTTDSLRPGLPPTHATGSKIQKPGVPAAGSPADTTAVRDGCYFSAGIGWSLGDFALLSLWEDALPDSLSSLGLSVSSFSVPYDSTAGNDQPPVDTKPLFFSIKEKTAIYTMSFPLSLSLVRIRENDRCALSLNASWMRKIFSATIAATGDTLDRKVDYKESMNVYSVFLSLTYGHRIPQHYFSIEGVERSFFNIALDFSPLIASAIRRNVSAPSSDVRFSEVKNHISSPPRRFLHGGAAGLRVGLNVLKRLNKNSASEMGAWFSILGYGYFLEHGDRVAFNDINPSNGKKDRPLYWISSRLDITFALMRRHGN